MKRSEKNIRPFLLFILVPAIFTFSAPAADSAPAVITDPVPGSVLTSTEVTFTWSDTGAEQYWLWIGSSEGTHDIYSGDQLTNTSKTLSDLSCNGETLYVRLSSKIGTDWISNDYTYTAPVIVAAEMQTPVQDSVLGSADVTFTWNDTGASHYWLWIGSSEGTYDIYSGDQLTNTSCTVSDLLCNGKTLYVRLFSKVCGEWLPNDYTYTAPVVEAAEMQTPVPGSVLGSGGATFTWNDTGVSQYWLWIGSSEGTHDIYSGDQLANTSSTVSELPYNGETLYVRLSSKVCGEWLSNDYTYTAPVIAVAEIHTPVPGSILRSTDTTFTWNDTGASQYWLWVGTSEGGKDIYSGGQGTNTSRKISGLPHNGETLYVRL
ncbi:MAG: hypothetical protein GY795_46110, partial [Desulfobacterales bacterium]|nr:hypothetical protein [Desulfobacterales bacterium]